MTQEVILFAPVGPYTDSLSQLIWVLYRRRNMAVVEAHVVVDQKGLRYLESDLLAPNQILDQLRRKLGPSILDRSGFRIHEARFGDGRVPEDDVLPGHSDAYLKMMWSAARAAIESAGDRPVVFGLCSVRRRTMSALQSAYFQLLARKQDLLLDVQVTDARVEGSGEFYFPEQDQDVKVGPTSIDPMRVDVLIVDLKLPRLGGLLGQGALESYDAAMEASQLTIDAASPPAISFELEEGRCRIDDELLPLSKAELAWYAFLASKRGTTQEGWTVIGQDGHDELRAFLTSLMIHEWMATIRTEPLRKLIAGEWVPDEDLRNLRGKTVQKLKQWCATNKPGAAQWIVPESDGGEHQRIPLPASRITLK